MNAKGLLKAYEYGLGFRKGDTLKPKDGAKPETYGVIDRTVVVLDQDSLAPHQYTVLGEREKYSQPSERFVKFTINGHNWDYAK